MPQAEEILAERWILVEKIDEGAMGEIFAARHAVLGHTVAVKVLMPSVTRDKAAVERFLREARIAARLQHHNVVRVEDFGVAADGRPFLVMELLRGESLAKRLSRAPRLTNAEALEVVRQIAAAVDVAHSAGIVHRDLKPENIFLANERGASVVKVLDFGVAKFTDMLSNGGHATASNTLIGTPRYMSPEQARSLRELDGRSDLWSLGMIAYEMITGSHPFEGEAIAELLVAILTHRIAPPSSLRPELPAAFDAWVERALARSRYDRFSTGRELADALSEALAGRLDERWAGFAYDRPRDASNRGHTVRARRPTPVTDVMRARRFTPDVDVMRSRRMTPVPEAPQTPVAAPLKLTPTEAQSPVQLDAPAPEVVAPAPEVVTESVVERVDAALAESLPAPQQEPAPAAPVAPRTSWWIAAAAALVAGLGLVVAIRMNTGVARGLSPSTAALVAHDTSRARVTSPIEPPPAAPPQPAAPTRSPPSPVEPPPAAVETPGQAQPTAAEGRPRRHHRSHHRGTHGSHDAAPTSSNARGTLYDPPGI